MIYLKTNYPIKKFVFIGIFFIVLFSVLMHFLYDLTGKVAIIGIISPINESVWEHLKLPLLPTIAWWLLAHYILKKENNIDFKKWMLSGFSSYIICILFILVFHYTYTGALGIESVFLDISSLILGVTIGQILALKIYKYQNIKSYHFDIVFFLFFIIITLFVIFTFKAPDLPIFKEQHSKW